MDIGKAPDKARGWLAVIGGVLVHLSFGTFYTFGNMSPYLTSYIRERSKPANIRYQDAAIIFAVNAATLGLLMPFGGVVYATFGCRLTVLISGSLMSGGVILSYLAIQSSFSVLIITYGLMVGVGTGIGYSAPLACAMKWLPKKKGLVNGIIVAGFGAGALVFHEIQTAYINPHNRSPNASLQGHPNEKYFDDDGVLDNVPSSFLLLGGIYAALLILGACLLSEPPADNRQKSEEIDSETELLNSKDKQQIPTDTGQHKTQNVDSKGSGLTLHPKEVIRTWSFWNLWGTFLFSGVGITFMPSLYKTFGQTFISDDKFLATVGALIGVANLGGRLFWGAMADFFSYRTAMLVLCSSYSVFMLTLMVAPKGGKSMFLVWTCAIFFTFNGVLSLFPTAVARAYGTKHVAINFSIIIGTALAITGPIGALVPAILQDKLGWNGTFAFITLFSALAFLLTLTFNVRRPTGERI